MNNYTRRRFIKNLGLGVLSMGAMEYLPYYKNTYADQTQEKEYDAIVIGTGFGGSVTAYKLAQKGKKVCILERGQKWTDKVNVKNKDIFDLADMVRTEHNPNGLFDYRIFDNIHVLQSNGVGGGSLIYANVIRRPEKDTDKDWPTGIKLSELEQYFESVKKKLKPRTVLCPQPLGGRLFPKTKALQQAAAATKKGQWQLSCLAIKHFDKPKNLEKVEEDGKCDEPETTKPSLCRACGNCVVVCNRSAKNTLDLNYLKDAQEAFDPKAELFAEHEAIKIEPLENGKKGYDVHCKNIQRIFRGKKVIVAAGSLGSTELLLRCRDQIKSLPWLSKELGKNFSANGDLQAFAVDTDFRTESTFGPTITSEINFQSTKPKFIVKEGGFPEALAPVANVLLPHLAKINKNMPVIKCAINDFIKSGKNDPDILVLLTSILKGLDINVLQYISRPDILVLLTSILKELDYSRIIKIIEELGPNINIKDIIMVILQSFPDRVSNSLMYLAMGKDASNGEMNWDKDNGFNIDWYPDHLDNRSLFDTMEDKLTRISEKGLGGSYYPNPLHVTVHPLGGCKMGNGIEDGVVDHTGEVFKYPNLYVADGSIFPKALGVNPSLTIAALAERNADIMLSKRW